MMLGLLSICRSRFCKITPQIYQTLFKDFSKSPQITTLGKYFTSSNLLEVYNIVKNSKLNPMDKISLFSQIQKKICTQNTDLEFNILANMHKDKSTIFLQTGQLAEAIIQIERAVKAIQGMQQPFNIQVVTLLQFAGNLHVKAQNYTKAQKFLKDAEHILNLTEEQVLQSSQIPQQVKQQQIKLINQMMARVLSQFCLVHIKLGHLFQARQYLAKAMQRWKTVQNKNNLAFLLTNQFNCILHTASKQDQIAIKIAQDYLQNYQPTQQTTANRMWFMKFLIDKGIDTYKEELQSNISELSKVLSQKDLSELLIKIGVLKKPKQQNPNSQNKNKQN